MNSNYMFYTDEEMKVIDEMQMEANRKLYIQEGIEKGAEQEKEETIKNMIKSKFTFDQISLAINKPVKEIKRIASSLNLI